MNRRFLLRVAAVSAIALGWSIEPRRDGQDPSLSRVQDSGVLRVGLDPSYPPFASYVRQGQIDGLDVSVAALVAEGIGVELNIVALDGGALLDSLFARKADIAVGVSPSRELLKDFRYSSPYFDGGQVLVRRSSSVGASLDGATVGVEAGSEADLRWEKIPALARAHRLRLSSTDDLLTVLDSGTAQAVLLDAVDAHRTTVTNESLSIDGLPLTHDLVVIAAHKSDASLLRRINDILAESTSSGAMDSIIDKWLR